MNFYTNKTFQVFSKYYKSIYLLEFMKKEDKTPVIVLLVILIIMAIAIIVLYLFFPPQLKNQPPQNISITDSECKNYTSDNCPGSCVVCPPCPACSSVSCNTKEFCNSIGFNENWFNQLNLNKQ